MSDLGEQLLRFRVAQSIKQIALASELGVTQATLSRWERGIQQPQGPVVRRIKRLLGHSPFDAGLGASLARMIRAMPGSASLVNRDLKYQVVSPFLTRLWNSRKGEVYDGSLHNLMGEGGVLAFERYGSILTDPAILGFAYNEPAHLTPGLFLRRSWTVYRVDGATVILQRDFFDNEIPLKPELDLQVKTRDDA